MRGDDTPSWFTFAGCVLLFIWVRNALTKAGDKITKTFELGENSAGPLQSETTEDIRRMERFVKNIHVTWSACQHPKDWYDTKARDMFRAMDGVGTDEAKLFSIVNGLNTQDLRALAKAFGVKEETSAGMTMFSGTLFDWFDRELSDSITGNDLTNMKKVFKKTGLWS